ncbi:hypothetical protein [Sinomonas gamaensis]|uniref:hypothetical protein n=1 Tax=Sinomonas gamaensis TaxID=2565624 RepID=UPI001108257B|nr:hypothetical protein [Sinomonas gamaensis]
MGHAATHTPHLPLHPPSIHVIAESAAALLAALLAALAAFGLSADSRVQLVQPAAGPPVETIPIPAADPYGMAARPTRDAAVKLVGICTAAKATVSEGSASATTATAISGLAAGLPSTLSAWRTHAESVANAAGTTDTEGLAKALQRLTADCRDGGY